METIESHCSAQNFNTFLNLPSTMKKNSYCSIEKCKQNVNYHL
jgi:hypothetical protein